jgi:23S rRNA (guanine745-N1)-methyltransferase
MLLICPICKNTLSVSGSSCCCINRHNFDISSKGYINLLLSHQKNSKEPGDNKLMVMARHHFLNSGLFQPLANTICSEVLFSLNCKTDICNILDSGCGEGYYIDALQKELSNQEINANIFGIDISKDAIKHASSRNKNISWIVGNSFRIPIASNTIDCILQVFSPCSDNEFARLIKKNGIIISVIPGKRHLFELKKLLYANPYENDEEEYALTSFTAIKKQHIEYEICIDNPENIMNLLMMTPYFYRTDAEDKNKLGRINKLITTVEFVVTVYRKTV